MTVVQPRYEFRVWGEEADSASAQLRILADALDETVTDEVYIVNWPRDDINAKIRAGVLDIKVLTDVAHDCERWEPWLKAEFPISAVLLRDSVLPQLGVSQSALLRDSYDLAGFIEEVVRTRIELQPVDVGKRRTKYEIAGCLAEIADVDVAGRQLRTLAVESTDLASIVELRNQLGLGAAENTSYPRALKHVLSQTGD